MVTTMFFLDTRKGEGPYSLKLRLTFRRKTAYMMTGQKFEVAQWNGFKVVKHPRAQLLNNQLATMKAEIDNKLYDWSVKGMLAGKDVKAIKAMLECVDEDTDFIAYWERASARRSSAYVIDTMRPHTLFRYLSKERDGTYVLSAESDKRGPIYLNAEDIINIYDVVGSFRIGR